MIATANALEVCDQALGFVRSVAANRPSIPRRDPRDFRSFAPRSPCPETASSNCNR
ncbi:hypothetical protein MESS4_330112 [Mesorhizobium sp. STM 4661]|nr:hypothetical protein MESS4_330112 [Mesorhizobium sp. STM 4661]